VLFKLKDMLRSKGIFEQFFSITGFTFDVVTTKEADA
jgi:hypothetical protein